MLLGTLAATAASPGSPIGCQPGSQITGQVSQVHGLTGNGCSVNVPCVPQMRLTMSSPEVAWYIRRPGDYYVEAFRGSVTSDALVAVTFSGFGNLENDCTGEEVPVYYCLQTRHPGIGEWVLPAQLSGIVLVVPPSEEAVEWALWQRVVLGDQSVGEYVGGGVVTFTMINMHDTFR